MLHDAIISDTPDLLNLSQFFLFPVVCCNGIQDFWKLLKE
jgi:hypothetical protein